MRPAIVSLAVASALGGWAADPLAPPLKALWIAEKRFYRAGDAALLTLKITPEEDLSSVSLEAGFPPEISLMQGSLNWKGRAKARQALQRTFYVRFSKPVSFQPDTPDGAEMYLPPILAEIRAESLGRPPWKATLQLLAILTRDGGVELLVDSRSVRREKLTSIELRRLPPLARRKYEKRQAAGPPAGKKPAYSR